VSSTGFLMSCGRSQEAEQPAGGPLELVGWDLLPGTDDVGQLARGRHAEATWAEAPARLARGSPTARTGGRSPDEAVQISSARSRTR
jgi:hypothetical protein